MDIRVYPHGLGSLRVAIGGELDLATADACQAGLVAVMYTEGTDEVVVDLAGLTFVDCAGLNALMVARSRGQSLGVTVRVEHAQPIVAMVLRVTGTWDMLVGPDHQPAAATWTGREPEQAT